MKKYVFFAVIFLAIAGLYGCGSMKNVPSDKIGMILTPTGWDQKVYTSGQVDLGQASTDGTQNVLYLVQKSGFQIKESFSNVEKEDHRCITGGDKSPFALDVRLLFALPDYTTAAGKTDLSRVIALGVPKEDSSDARIMNISVQSVYEQQAQMVVRNKIRMVCTQFKNFDEVWAANVPIGEETSTVFQKRIEKVVAQALVEAQVPLRVVSAFPSNLKQDDTITAAISATQSANERIKAIDEVVKYLDKDMTGNRTLVYQLQTMQEIVNKARENGHDTIIIAPGASLPGLLLKKEISK